MNIPANLKYTPDHEWIKVEGNTGIIGLTDFAQSQLGDVVFVEIECLGKKLDKGQSFGTVEAVKTVSEMYMPVSGEVIEVNTGINDSPETVNKDPYGAGWMIKIKISKPEELNELLDSAKYSQVAV